MITGGTIEGAEDWARRVMQLAGPEAMTRIGRALYGAGEQIIATAEPMVPRDEGVLVGTGMVQEPEQSGDAVSVTLGYGGAASDYAVEQHENLTYVHEHGEAKFLEKATLQRAEDVQSAVRSALLELYAEVTS